MAGETFVRTGREEFDGLFPLVQSFLERDRLDLSIDGRRVRGYRTPDTRSIWIRGHSDMLRAVRYFEPDLTSAVEHFAYTAGRHGWLQFQVTDDTYWGVMHGDNSGYHEAFRLIAALSRHLGSSTRAAWWGEQADAIRRRMNAACWNGRFYTHFVKLTPVVIPGVDEADQLSLSNPMDINRGVADHAQAVSILREYQRRGRQRRAFAEWFSIDPPFPDGVFGDEKLVRGAYCNGGIMPLVGGELARAAFEHGLEAYGVDILRRYWALAGRSGATDLWYFPDGTPSSPETSASPEAQPTDGWGSSTMAWAFLEGLAGVADQARVFERVRLAPRWPAADVTEAEVAVGYACSGAGIRYSWRLGAERIHLDVAAVGADLACHILLPGGAEAHSVRLGARETTWRASDVEASRYADFDVRVDGEASIEIRLR